MVACPYCNKSAELVSGSVIYPHRSDLSELKFYRCLTCRAYVGCHKRGARVIIGGRKTVSDGTLPLGRLADAALRKAKSQAHAAFDPLWMGRVMRRKQAYAWLSKQMGLPVDLTHIGEFDPAQCKRVVEVCEAFSRDEA